MLPASLSHQSGSATLEGEVIVMHGLNASNEKPKGIAD
jgi:hypothetical protein